VEAAVADVPLEPVTEGDPRSLLDFVVRRDL
jgi:hypothetical protein